ncbi:MAG: hypothetical protein ABJH04_05675 [Cyclobacteriaceae bacterium]
MSQSYFESSRKVGLWLCKSLYLFLILKILFLWPILSDIIEFTSYKVGPGIRQLVFLPLVLTKSYFNEEWFLGLFIALLLVSLLIRTNYISGILIFWFSLSLSKLIFSVSNGSDLILNIFLFISIFVVTNPNFNSKKLLQFQIIISNAALLLGQIQIALIYFLSGYDKLTSLAWQTGAAMNSITNLTFFQNPFLSLELTEFQCILLCWLIILFELGFSFLIWFNKFRVPMLTLGVMFHLGIVLFLGLADFGIVMILCYTLFMPIQKESVKKLVIANG